MGCNLVRARIGCALLVSVLVSVSGLLAQKPLRSQPSKPTPSKPAPAKAEKANASLLIKSSPGEALVLVDGNPVGSTRADGILAVPKLAAGEHFITIRKADFQEEQRNISVTPGLARTVEVILTPLPAKLNIHPSVPGAQIEIVGVRTFDDRVSNVLLKAGQHEVRVTKPGYRPFTRSIELRPNQEESIEIPLEPVPVEEQLAILEDDLEAANFDGVIKGCGELMKTQPGNPRANLLMGLAFFRNGDYSESLTYLSNAIDLGETATLPIKHHHRAGMMGLDDDLCDGQVTFKKGSLEFHSLNKGGHDFSIPSTKLYEIKSEPQKAGRVSIVIGLSATKKEERKTFNFHSQRAGVRLLQPGNPYSVRVVYCNYCEPMMQVFYALLMKVK